MADEARTRLERWEWVALGVVLVLDLVLARRVFGAGFMADNDFITHVAWTQYLVEEHWPATHAVFGWNPHHGTGLPFLLYNTPPGLVLASAALCLIPGVGPVGGVKGVLLAGWLATPLLAFGFARSFRERPATFPVLAAVFVSLFSSELFGLEFFFKNGMANAAMGIPLMLAVWWSFRVALRDGIGRARWMLLLSGVLYGLLIATHVTSAYMAAIGVVALAVVGSQDQAGERIARGAAVGLVGLVTSAWWWWPSLALVDHAPAAFTWIRSPSSTLWAIADGSLWSSYPVGFFERFVAHSKVGIIVTLMAAVGALTALRQRHALSGLVVVASLGLWFALGPAAAGPLSGAPLYENLLWYRFITLLSAATLILAAYGSAVLIEAPSKRLRLGSRIGLASALLAALVVIVGRSSAIRVSTDYPAESQEFTELVGWMNEHAERPGRIYSEFPRDLDDAISVNHSRHMLPLETGLDEAAVWIYENNHAGQHLMARGLLWDNARPMLWLAERYDVRTFVAYSPGLKHVLDDDPRWRLGWSRGQTSAYQATTGVASLVEAELPVALSHREESALPGGGYRYALRVNTEAERLTVKVNYSPFWQASVQGSALATEPSADGLLELTLPPGTEHDVELEWTLVPQQRQGWLASLLGGLLLVLGSSALRGDRLIPSALPPATLPALLGATAVLIGVRGLGGPSDDIHTGLRDGMAVTRGLDTLNVGSYSDLNNGQLLFLLPDAWSERQLDSDQPARQPLTDGMAVIASAPEAGLAQLTVEGRLLDDEASPHLRLFSGRTGDLLCEVPLELGTPKELPAECINGAPRVERMPGRALGIGFSTPSALVVDQIHLTQDSVAVHGESLRNQLDDGGADAHYFVGLDGVYAHNGALLTVPVNADSSPVSVDRSVPLVHGQRYELWALMACAEPELAGLRASMRFTVDGSEVGQTDGVDAHPGLLGVTPMWVRIGETTGDPHSTLEVTFTSESEDNAWADLDAVLFTPVN
ncbi:MAG: hypothetical protein KC912_25025 [Proteobacteria bacterium]|nr:hypothetical protein [Pseudomonadota bacterium]